MAVKVLCILCKEWVKHRKIAQLRFKVLVLYLCLLIVNIQTIFAYKCSNLTPNSTIITSEQCKFSGYTTTRTYGVATSQTSNNLYYLHLIDPPTGAVVRKVDSSGTQIWMASFQLDPQRKSLIVDLNEQSVYLAIYSLTLAVLSLNTNSGGVNSQQSFTGIIGNSTCDLKIFPFSDNSGYFVFGTTRTLLPVLCKYTFSSSTSQCQSVNTIQLGFAQIMVSSNQFFILGADISSPYNLRMCKYTFASTSADWENKMVCASGTCASHFSESLLSKDGAYIYSFFIYGSTSYLYFATLAVSTGNVISSRYKSSVTIAFLYGSALNGDYILTTTNNPSSLVIFSLASSIFTIKSFNSGSLQGLGIEPSSGRLIVTADFGSNGYTSKFSVQSIDSLADFSTGSWIMNVLASGTEVITSIALPSPTTATSSTFPSTISAGPYVNQSVAYVQQSSYSFSTYLQTNTQALSLTENNNSTLTPDLPCSPAGVTQISYSMISCSGANFPSFVSLNSTSGILSIEAPSVSSSTDYGFCVDSLITGVTNTIRYTIKLTIKKCTASNCQRCSATDSSVCTICNSGYNLISGTCDLPESHTARSLSLVNQIVIGVTIGLCLVSSLLNSSSMASLWSMINQIQIFFLLLITGAFIPKDIENIIIGLKICLNPFSYFQSSSGEDSNFVSNFFNFGLKDSNLEKLGIKSDSTIVNIYSFILSIAIICVLHLCIKLSQNFLMKESKSNYCQRILTIMHWILTKLMVLFTFAMYIRVILKTNQYILVSCVSEVYYFNDYGTKRVVSLVVAILTLIASLTMVVIVVLLVCNQIDEDQESPDKRNKFAQLFNGVSHNVKSRLYIAFLQIRRAIFVILLVTIEPQSSILVISILVGLQVIYLGILVIIRPFELVKCNIIEIVNEMYFLTMLASLLKYNSITNWEGTPTTIYTWFMSSNSISGFTIIFIDFVRKLIVKLKDKCCNKNAESTQNNQVHPAIPNRMNYTVDEVESSNIKINKIKPVLNMEVYPNGVGHRIGNRVYYKR